MLKTNLLLSFCISLNAGVASATASLAEPADGGAGKSTAPGLPGGAAGGGGGLGEQREGFRRGGSDHGARHHHGDEEGGMMDILTPAQRPQVKALMEQSRASMEPVREQMRALRAQSESGEADPKAQQKMAALREQMRAGHKATHDKIMSLFTPDQKKQWEARREQLRSQMGSGERGPGQAHHRMHGRGAAANDDGGSAPPAGTKGAQQPRAD